MFFTILYKISKKQIQGYEYFEYIKQLKNIYIVNTKHRQNKNEPESNTIPLLLYNQGDGICDIVKQIMIHIQTKIRASRNQQHIPELCPIECLVLFHMIGVHDNGIYHTDISIKSLYEIIQTYVNCDINSRHTTDYNCICHTIVFNDFQEIPDADIQLTLTNHYEQVTIIRTIFNNYRDDLLLKFPNSTFAYKYNYKVSKTDDTNSINVSKKCIFVAYSDTDVIYFILKPNITKINSNDIVIDSIFSSYFISTCSNTEQNEELPRFLHKNIHTCVITLNSNVPIWYSYNQGHTYFKENIDYVLTTIYTRYHTKIYKYYKYCLPLNPEQFNKEMEFYENKNVPV